ncbi:zeta toxin [Flavobacterium potami]|uniref:zeta toxin n=1 Tax=Flavobacterium potami TaxID=2872310 RepID=UPI001CBC7CCC|nr:zeta toxin [Flavobacterium potami]
MPQILDCKEFVNADEIAKGLSPFQPEKVAFEAGRIMLRRIDELLLNDEVFAFETTLATKSYKSKVKIAQEKKYKVVLLFFWLQDVDLAIERVKTRIKEGGHNIEIDVIRRRYVNGIKNLFDIYLPIVDEVMIFDNSFGKPELLAQKMFDTEIDIINELKYNRFKNNYNENI